MEESRDPLESSNSRHLPYRQQQSSGLLQSPLSVGAGLQRSRHKPSLLHAQIWAFCVAFVLDPVGFFASQKFPWKTRNLGLHFLLVLPPRQKTWGKLLG